ncbi:MAG: hypothetical protein ACAI43_11725 [Phycisphaerae bacterium]|nr:hypothetical protein [Tepidisphaeraceae bacterium]
MDRTKDAVARRLAESHYEIDQSIVEIVRLLAPDRESDVSEPVKLLEVNRDTSLDGIVPVHFGPHAASGTFFPSIIVEVRPEEYEQIQSGQLRLPHGWQLGPSYRRPAVSATA